MPLFEWISVLESLALENSGSVTLLSEKFTGVKESSFRVDRKSVV